MKTVHGIARSCLAAALALLFLRGVAFADVDAQFVEPDDVFVADRDLEYRDVSCTLAKLVAPPGTDGVARFRELRPPNRELRGSHFWRAPRVAKAEELRVGALVVYPLNEVPGSREVAGKAHWELTRIASLDALAEEGVVITLGVKQVDAGKLRLVEGDASPPIVFSGPEDRHFFHAEHWLVWTDKAPPPTDPAAYAGLAVALAPRPPASPGGEGEFIVIATGQHVRTSYAFRTRLATKADLKPGVRAAFGEKLDLRDGPRHRDAALQSRWVAGPITKIVDGGNVYYFGETPLRLEGVRILEGVAPVTISEAAPPRPTEKQDAQFVEDDDFFVSDRDRDLQARTVSVQIMKRQAPGKFHSPEAPKSAGKYRFYWQTRLAEPGDLKVGALVVYPASAPASRADALRGSWSLGRIGGLDDLVAKGVVTLAGLQDVDAKGLRVVVSGSGAQSTPIAVSSPEDRHFLHAEHWLVRVGGGFKVALALAPPAKPGEEGEFIVVDSGARVKTSDAVRTRAAEEADIAVGTRVAIIARGSAQREGPAHRSQALREEWLVAPIEAPADARGDIQLAGGAATRLGGMRVVVAP